MSFDRISSPTAIQDPLHPTFSLLAAIALLGALAPFNSRASWGALLLDLRGSLALLA